MTESHFDQMTYLLGFILLLMVVIVGTIALSVAKKRKSKKELDALAEKAPEEARIAKLKAEIGKGLPYQNIQTIDVEVEEKPEAKKAELKVVHPDITSEKDISITEEILEKETTLAEALVKTEESFFGRIKKAFSNTDKEKVIDEIEEILYTSDLGPQTVEKLLEVVRAELSSKQMSDISVVKKALRKEMSEIMDPVQDSLKGHSKIEEQINKAASGPTVLMIVGVNGAGKTTSIGKITAQLAKNGEKVLVAAGDTFRAAAGNQLKMWTDRAQAGANSNGSGGGEVEIFWPTNTTDPSAVAFDAVTKAKAQNFNYVILDTAGRLHTQVNLMEELKKVKRVMTKVIPEAPHETWIVLDANSGQNALLQAKEFNQALNLTGVVLTKMDGTAKGGVALGLVDQLQIPIKLVGIGEKVTDLRLFNHVEYVDSILGL